MKDELGRIAVKAGEFFLERDLTSVVSKEGHANYVTNIDCRVQAYLEEALLKLQHPEDPALVQQLLALAVRDRAMDGCGVGSAGNPAIHPGT
jgi:hypothetical protein